jgi:hypothetical protein
VERSLAHGRLQIPRNLYCQKPREGNTAGVTDLRKIFARMVAKRFCRMRFEILTAVHVSTFVFWVETPCERQLTFRDGCK